MSTKAYIDTATAAIVQPMIDSRDERIAELEAELSELREAMLPLIAGYGYCSFLDDKERLDDPDIKRAMAALLNGEQEAPRIKTTWQADWERGS